MSFPSQTGLYRPLRTVPFGIRLLVLDCAEPNSEGIKCTWKEVSLGDKPSYHIISFPDTDEEADAIIDISGTEFRVTSVLRSALSALASHVASTPVWIEEVCVNPEAPEEKQQCNLHRREIHKCAQEIIIWTGNDYENGFMTSYLGRLSQESKEHALAFANLLAEADPSDVSGLLRDSFAAADVRSWYHLIRILFGHWFRNSALLGKSYLDELNFVTVRCGSASVSWPVLKKASNRLRVANPTPMLLLLAKFEDPMDMATSDRRWLEASIAFGFDRCRLLARMMWIAAAMEEQPLQHERFMIHMGLCDDFYDEKFLSKQLLSHHRKLKRSAGHETVAGHLFDLPERLPSMPFKGRLSPAPLPEDQIGFVHPRINDDDDDAIPLLLLLPHDGDPQSPVQCGFITATEEAPVDFTYVLNATLDGPRAPAQAVVHNTHREVPESVPFHPVPRGPGTVALILVNGMSFEIPKILEIFLRCMRQEDDPEFLFVWQICMDPDDAAIGDRGVV